MDFFRKILLLAISIAVVAQSSDAQQGETWTTTISYMIVDNATLTDGCPIVGCGGLIPYASAQSLMPFYENCKVDTVLQSPGHSCLLQTAIEVTKRAYVEAGTLYKAGNIPVEEMMSLPVDCPASTAPEGICTLRLEGEITLNPNCLQGVIHDPCTIFSNDEQEAVLKTSSRNRRLNCKCTITSKKPQAFDIQMLNLQSIENKEEETTVNFVRIWNTVANEYLEEGIQLYPSMHRLKHVRSLDIRFFKNGNSDALQILTIRAASAFTLRCGAEARVPVGESMAGVGMTIFLLIVLIAVTLFVFYWQRQDPPRPGYSEDFARPTSMMSLIDHGQPEPVVLYQNTSSLENTFQLEGSMPDLTIDRRRSQQMGRLSRTYSSPNLP